MNHHHEQTILVTGATGNQGGAVARHLHADGWQVRALTRDPDSPKARALKDLGLEVVRGDTTDRASLDDALRGVYGVFAVATPFEKGPENEIVQGTTLGDAAAAAGVRHFVYSSVGGAERKTGIPHFESKFEVEKYLGNLGFSLTVLRPVFFMENLVFWSTQRSDAGALSIPMPLSPDKKLAMIAVEDIAAFAALAFEHPATYVGLRLEIAGDELTLPEAAALLSEQLGEPVTYVQIPFEAVRSQNEDFYRMYDWFEREGYTPDFAHLRELHPGLIDFRAWVSRGAAAPLAKAA
jgi:uncharacterized protein YbjT (DUF2867 family)